MKYEIQGIIAFCGSKFSGKSTSATIFKELINAPTEEIAIAGSLKETAARVFNLDINLFLDPQLKEVELDDFIVLGKASLEGMMKGFNVTDFSYDNHIRPHVGRIIKTPRGLLQYIGTEVLHPIDPLIHVKKAIYKKDPTKLTIITDLRFEAEFEHFVTGSIQFNPVYVKNSAAEAKASMDGHASEREYERFRHKCVLLDNEGSLAQLSLNLSKLIGETYDKN